MNKERSEFNSQLSPYEKEFRQVAKEHLREYVESVTSSVPRAGSNFYICPCCKSGTGNNRHFTPAFHLFRTRRNELCFKCHACGITGNIFTLAGLVHNTTSPKKKQQLVADFLGVDLKKQTPLTEIHISDKQVAESPTRKRTIQLKKEAHDYIVKCRNHVSETDYFVRRGFTKETIKRFSLGYDPERQEAIIPFGVSYYIGRNVHVGVDEKAAKKHYKPKGISQPVFNLAALSAKTNEPIFIVEAPIDAISIMQCGGTAIALGGTSSKIFEKVLDVYRPTCHFVLAFDSDPPGLRAQDHVAALLKEYKLSYSLAEHYAFSRYKDANAILMADPHLLEEATALEKDRLRERTLSRAVFPSSLDDAKQTAKIAAAAKQALKHFERPAKSAEMEGR